MRIFDSNNKKQVAPSETEETGLRGAIIDAIKTVYDPEIPVNVYDLGLIYAITIDESSKHVAIDMTLTSPNCPVAEALPNAVQAAVANLDDVNSAKVTLVWEPAWDMERMCDEAKLDLGFL